MRLTPYLQQSKLSSDVVNKAVDAILAFSAGKDVQVNDKTVIKGKKRKFLETVELQIGGCSSRGAPVVRTPLFFVGSFTLLHLVFTRDGTPPIAAPRSFLFCMC